MTFLQRKENSLANGLGWGEGWLVGSDDSIWLKQSAMCDTEGQKGSNKQHKRSLLLFYIFLINHQ
jgi:hypothetical protein